MQKIAFITGASSGIGQQLVREFAGRGYRVGMVARRGALLQDLNTQLGGQHVVVECDVTDHAALMDAAAQFISTHGCPDVVIANAGISRGTLVEYPQDHAAFADIFNTNVVAMYSTFAAFANAMKTRGSGTLVGIASVAGVRGLPGSEAYSASKAAAIAFCESVRVELRSSGVRVVNIMPGFIATPMTAKNPYKMPFLMQVEPFARKAADAIEAGRSQVVIPWQMGWVAKLLRLLPNRLYDAAFEKSGRKPRG